MVKIEIFESIKAVEVDTDNYKLIIRDAKDIYHFFKKDGTYDGYDKQCEECKT